MRDETDGRVALRLRNRQHVVDALVELIEEGEIEPSMGAIVERSGISERSIFRYFNDLKDLSLSAIRTAVERTEELSAFPDSGEGSFEVRIDRMIEWRLYVAERTHVFGTVAHRKLAVVPEIQQARANVLALLRAHLANHFSQELDAMPEAHAVGVLDTLVTLLSYEGYDVLRFQLGNDDGVVAERWRSTLLTLLASEKS